MNYLLFDDTGAERLKPFTYLRPSCDIRVGISTIREKWTLHLGTKPGSITAPYLSEKFPYTLADRNILLNGRVIPSPELCRELEELKENEKLFLGETLVAAFVSGDVLEKGLSEGKEPFMIINGLKASPQVCHCDMLVIEHPWDIFRFNGECMLRDFRDITQNKKSQPISDTNRISGSWGVFLEEGAIVEHAIINAAAGPVYIGKDAMLEEGCLIRGGLALCEGAVLKLGSKVYGPTTLGPHSKAGGELNNVVFFGYSNKAHDGFLGNAVIGEWCNLGADTNCSNLKNNYSSVKVFDYQLNKQIDSGLQFCGLLMGDHSRCGINTMFNTGTITGISCNIFGAGFPPVHIPSFSWGGAEGFSDYQLDKAFEASSKMMERRHIQLTDADKSILRHVFEMTARHRNY